MLLAAHDEVRDRLGNGCGFCAICAVITGFEAQELEPVAVAVAILRMLELTSALSGRLFVEFVRSSRWPRSSRRPRKPSAQCKRWSCCARASWRLSHDHHEVRCSGRKDSCTVEECKGS
jgi:hypothetical protein